MESVEVLNKRLIDHFSIAWNGWPIYRIVWSEDQFEKRRTNYTDAGIQLLHSEVRLLPKYKQYIQNKFILERLTIVPEISGNDLTEKISYEPIYVFEDRHGNALSPKWEAAKFVVDALLAATGKESMGPKYIDPESTPEMAQEFKETKLKELELSLFGNESNVGDALAHNQAVIVPRNYEKAN